MSASITLINPAQDSRDTAQLLATGSRFTTIAVCLTTGVGVFIWAKDLAYKYLLDFPGASIIAPAIGLLFAIGAGWLTDVGFGKILQKVIFNFLAARHPNVVKWNTGQSDYFNSLQKGERVGLVLLLILLLTLDVVSTYIITEPVSQQAANLPTINVDSLRTNLASANTAEIAALTARSKEKKREIAEASSRVVGANPALLKLKNQGNAWAAQTIASKQAKATKSHQTELEKNEQTVSISIEQGKAYIAARIAEAEETNLRNQQRNQKAQETAGTMYLIFSIGLKVLTILLRIMLVVTFCAYSYRFSPDLTGDGIVNYDDLQAFGKTPAPHPNFQ